MTTSWGEWVSQQLTRRELRPADAAETTGVNASLISRWVSGQVEPGKDNARKFANGMGVSVVDALIAWGCVTEDEIFRWLAARGYAIADGTITPPDGVPLGEVSTQAIVAELHRRVTQDQIITEQVPDGDEPAVTLRVRDAPPEVLANPVARGRVGKPRDT